MSFSVEDLHEMLNGYKAQHQQAQAAVHSIIGAMGTIEFLIKTTLEKQAGAIKDEALAAAKAIAEQEAANLINSAVPGAGEAVVGIAEQALLGASTDQTTPAEA